MAGAGPDHRICWLCGAGLCQHNWCFDFTSSAAWRRTTLRMPSSWLTLRFSGRFISEIWSIPGFVLEYVRPDFMHAGCLGILQYFWGNCVFECFQHLNGTFKNPKPACSKFLSMFKAVARDLNVDLPIGNLVVGMFRAGPSACPKMNESGGGPLSFANCVPHLGNLLRY